MKPHLGALATGRDSRLLTCLTIIGLGLALLAAVPAGATTFIVDSSGDAGDASAGDGSCATAGDACTLRAAIEEVNALATGAPHTIGFSVASLQPTSELPQVIRDGTLIDGWTHPGHSTGGPPAVVLSGESAGSAIGIRVGGSNITIRGLQVYSFQRSGVVVEVGLSGVTIQGCYIGTNGTTDLGNGEYGILIDHASTNQVGGTGTGEGNVISGNTNGGVLVSAVGGGSASGNTVLGNLIGLNAAGTAAIPNSSGVTLMTANGNTVGGAAAAARNVISGNTFDGVTVASGATGNVIYGNYIGTDPSGTAAIPNRVGVHLVQGAASTTVGGSVTGEGNLISGNTGEGIYITGGSVATFVLGNLIGTAVSGAAPLGNGSHGILAVSAPDVLIGGISTGEPNTIAFNGGSGIVINEPPPCILKRVSANSIHDNAGLGIDLGDDGVTPNDPGDPDVGPNGLQNFPVLATATSEGGQIEITGTLNSLPSLPYRVELFSSPACDPSGYGEGAAYLGGTDVTTDASGNASFSVTLSGSLAYGSVVTATATDSSGNTSEFSACLAAQVQGAEIPALSPAGRSVLALLLAGAALGLLRRRLG